MKLDLITARVILRAIQRGLPVEETLSLVEALLDGFDIWDCLEYLMRQSLEGNVEEVAVVCERMKGPVPQGCEEVHCGW